MTTRAVISYSDCMVPEKYLSIPEYVEMLEESYLASIDMSRDDLANILKNSIGIQRIYVEDRKREAEMFCTMLERYFAKTRIKPGEVDYIIYTRGDSVAHGNPWSMIDEKCLNIPYFLQQEFKMEKAQIFNVEQVCAGTLIGAKLALSLVKDGSAREILLLSGNFFRHPENRLMGGLGLVSDAAGLAAISAAGTGLALLDYEGCTDGSITMVKDFRRGTIPARVVQVGTGLIKKLVKKNDLTLAEISLLIPQNISKSGWNFYCQLLEFPKEKVFLDNFDDGGHMGDVDILRNLTEVKKRGLLSPGNFALIYGIGTGTSWNALLVKAV
jgi:3-oxoacyl-[acyl-carrier-protein] synthase III